MDIRLFCHLGPSWFQPAYVMSSMAVILLKFVPCSFPPVSLVVVVQSLSCVRLFVTPWTAAHQAPLFSTISQSLLKRIFIELVMRSSHLILCCSLFLLPSIFISIKVFSSELARHIRWPKYWSFNFSSNEYSFQ